MPAAYTFRLILILISILIVTAEARAGLLFALNDQNGAPNLIHGFIVDEITGALIPMPAFPISSGGNGTGSTVGGRKLAIDRANRRLYVVNDGSNTVSAFSIDGSILTPLPFSPIALPADFWTSISIHPSGSPIIITNSDGTGSPVIASFAITATTATPAPGSPYAATSATAAAFSRDGNFLYTGGSGDIIAAFAVNSATGALAPLPGSPFASGTTAPTGFATDSKGRLFASGGVVGTATAFTTIDGILAPVTANPIPTATVSARDAILHPNEKFFYIASAGTPTTVSGFQILGDGSSTTLSAVAGSPVGSQGSETRVLTFNGSGTRLFALNSATRNITTYSVNEANGTLTFGNVQVANALGTTGAPNSMAYMPSISFVTNTNNTGAGSLRFAVDALSDVHRGGMVIFEKPFFSVPRTITLTSQINIDQHLNIVGPGADLLTIRNTAPQGPQSRVFSINNSAVVTLRGLTIAGGNLPSTVSSGGAGISTNGTGNIVHIFNCWITQNFAASFGGGVVNAGILLVVGSTISGNTSASSGAGGSGIDNVGTLFVRSSTISGNVRIGTLNSAGGIWNGGIMTLTNSTVTNNQSNIGASGVFTSSGAASTRVRNTIIAGNRDTVARPDVGGAFGTTNAGFNLIGAVGTATGFNQTGDQAGTGASPIDPRLVEVLTFKGGSTPVHMPLPGSPAIDKGNNSNHLTDQRGSARPFDNPAVPNSSNGTDIGAVELRALDSIFAPPFDFDGDSKTDIGIFRPSVREWWISRSSTGSILAAQFGATGDSIVPGDYTGDGRTDIAVWRPVDGNWYILRSEDSSFFAFPFGANGDTPVPADFDGDGKADAAVFRPQSATWFVRQSSDGVAFQQTFGSSSDHPVPADYDGDGRSDIAIYRPSLGEWWLSRSTLGVIAVTFGNSSDKPVQGDYTGDGKMDVAFWRPSTGEWFVLRSEDFSFFSFPFGANGDIPAPGDYDGDGKQDATIFRPSETNWYLQRSTSGTLILQFGASGDRPIPNAFIP